MPQEQYTLEGKKVWVAGHHGMVGSALVRRLESEKCTIVCVDRKEVDLRRQSETEDWLLAEKPDLVFLSAARVGGIVANSSSPGEFLYDNLMIEANVMEAARRAAVSKLVFLGSSCIYPRDAHQPIIEEALLTGSLEPTNEWYAIAKIAGIKMAQAYRRQYGCDFISAQPTNIYGPGDNFDLETSHVLPALMRKAHESKQKGDSKFVVWGSGRPMREFLHVDDLADALVFLAKHYSGDGLVNVGTGKDISIADIAALMLRVVGSDAQIEFDTSNPDGTPRKLLDVGRMTALGWQYSTEIFPGLEDTYQWFLENMETARGLHHVDHLK
jgi:GDP-L-fucose synthase